MRRPRRDLENLVCQCWVGVAVYFRWVVLAVWERVQFRRLLLASPLEEWAISEVGLARRVRDEGAG